MAVSTDVSVLVIGDRGRDALITTLNSIVKETHYSRTQVIVANCSTPSRAALDLATHASAPEILNVGERAGFATAANLASASARGRYLLVLEAGTEILDGAIDELVAFAESDRSALVWGGLLLAPDGAIDQQSYPERLTLTSLLRHALGLPTLSEPTRHVSPNLSTIADHDEPAEQVTVSGGFLMMTRTVFTALGGFDPAFDRSGADEDFCLRARRIGARPVLLPIARAICSPPVVSGTTSGMISRRLATQATLIDRHWPTAFIAAGQSLLMMAACRAVLHNAIAAALTGSAKHRAMSTAWREVWSRRMEWRFGRVRPYAPVIEPRKLSIVPPMGHSF